MTPLEKARTIAAMYPVMMRTYGRFRMDGVLYVWDPVLQDIRASGDLKAAAKEEKEKRIAARAQAKRDQMGFTI